MNDKRINQRKDAAIEVLVQPVDENYQPVGPPLLAETHDLSAAGLCVRLTLPIDTPFLSVEMASATGETKNELMEVVRRQSFEGYVELGCRFVSVSS